MAIDKRIYTVATAHLDTVWNWDFEHTISECIFNTLADNFKLFEEYPEYKFSFEGAYRYELMEEYYPELFEQLKVYIEKGKWNVAGSSYENGDVNVPAPETLFRNILYGNEYFDKKFGKRSKDIYLPDCFGFGWALPSIAKHANLSGFTTQKLTWGSANGIPFDLGRWYGPDGKWIFASLDAGDYTASFDKSLRKNKAILAKLKRGKEEGMLPWTMTLHGTGDQGGAPEESSVKLVVTDTFLNQGDDVQVYSVASDKIFRDMSELTDDEKYNLPEFRDELLMTKHGAGAYTSRGFSKRMNRRNEEIANMAEVASVNATALTGTEYPQEELEKAWKRVIAHTFHDDITGTSVQRVYLRSWNDLIMSANQFRNIYEGSSQQVIKNLDTSWVQGTAVVLGNAIEQPRLGVAELTLYGEDIEYIRVFDEKGNEFPCQISEKTRESVKVVFTATVPAMGYKVFDLRLSSEMSTVATGIRVTERSLENDKYFVQLDDNGNISSIIDKTLANKELLSKPIGNHVMLSYGGREYPAWEIEYDGVKGIPWEFAGKGETQVIERGPARITLKVKQTTDHADYTYYVSLTAGGQYVEVQNEVDWRTTCALLKNRFSFTASNKKATFDLGLGVIERGNRNKKMYEVPAQRWADISDEKHYYGVSVFSDSKYGWDKADNNTLRLTAIHTPKGNFREDSMQSLMDLGLNRYGYAIYSHHGGYENGTQLQARIFNQPVGVFVTDNHAGTLGSEYSFGSVSHDNIIIRAVKKAENSDEIIVRVNEGAGKVTRNAKFILGNGIESAREVYASEEHLAKASLIEGRVIFDINPFEVKTFAVKLKDCKTSEKAEQKSMALPFNVDIVTYNNEREATIIPTKGVSIPAEILPEDISCGGVNFRTGNTMENANNALICDGQEIEVDCDLFSFIGASLVGDAEFDFVVDDSLVTIPVQALEERIGCWDLYGLNQTAFIKRDKVAWECTHTHSVDGDNVANQLFFFRYDIPVKGAKKIKLPEGNGLLVLSATEVKDTADTILLSDMYDTVEARPFRLVFSEFQASAYEKQLRKVMSKEDIKAKKINEKEDRKLAKDNIKAQKVILEHQKREESENEKKSKKEIKVLEKEAKKAKKTTKKTKKSKKDVPVEEDVTLEDLMEELTKK